MPHRLFCVSTFLIGSTTACMAGPPPNEWRYDGEFHDAISAANRVVVRTKFVKDGQPSNGDNALFEVTSVSEIRQIADHLKFKSPQLMDSCMCSGDPTLDWFRGDTKLACVAVKHGAALHWRGLPGDCQLTQNSAEMSFHIPEMESEVYSETDREAAARVLRALDGSDAQHVVAAEPRHR